jgi:hypothetical protein
MNNQYVNLSPQQRMAQALQQQQPEQMRQPQMPQAQNPMQDIPAMMQMYMRNKQMQGAAQQPMGGMFDRVNAVGPAVTANEYTG